MLAQARVPVSLVASGWRGYSQGAETGLATLVVRMVWTSGSGSYRVRLDYLDWRYLPASATNRALSDIRAQHPKAPVRPLAAMPHDATRQLLHTIGEARAPRARP
jgi:hypothetical protein